LLILFAFVADVQGVLEGNCYVSGERSVS